MVVKNLSDRFVSLYMSYGYKPDFYKGYEITGGYSGSGNNYDPDILPLESVLSKCICKFYEETKDWKYLSPFIHSQYDKDNPVFVKRSFIPFLLNQLNESSEKNPEDNNFYKALKSILKIKKGFPSTEHILAKTLREVNIKDNYLKELVEMILYKYSENGMSYDILTIQFLLHLIENGKSNFKIYLKKILLNKDFKNHYVYKQALDLFERKMENKNIKEFFNEIKGKLDISKMMV